MIHGGLRSIVADRFPCARMDVKGEGRWGGFRGLAVVADSVVVVGIVGAAGEINFAGFSFERSRACRDAIARAARMCWKFRPFNFCDVAFLRMWNFSHPAFAGGDVLGIGT